MIAYKYKLYTTKQTKHLDAMLREASWVWNHALALQKRYYRMYGGGVSTQESLGFSRGSMSMLDVLFVVNPEFALGGVIRTTDLIAPNASILSVHVGHF